MVPRLHDFGWLLPEPDSGGQWAEPTESIQKRGDPMSLIPSATKSFGYPIMLILILLSVAVTEPLSAQEHMANLGTRHFEMSMEMTPTADGNFVTVGPVVRNNSLVGGSAVKIYLNKIDEDSQVIWSRRIAESPDGQHVPLSVVEVTDPNGSAAGYAITGFDLSLGMSEPIFVVTTDLNGHITNFRRFGGALPIPGSNLAPIAGVGNKIIQNQQGELVIIGSLLLTDQLGVVPFLLNVGTNLSLNFMRIYHDSRYLQQGFGIGSLAHFDDIAVAPAIQDPETGQFAPNGYLITGGTLQSGSSISAETFVLRTDLGGNPVVAVAYGPLAGESAYSRGRALEYTSLGLVKVVSHYFVPTGAPVSTQIFTLNPGNLVLLQQDHYHDFISLGDIRETVNGEFILAGRDVASTDGAVLRLRNDGRAPFYRGYGSANVELLTDVHELHDGTLYSSGVTTTWCRGSADQYLVRSRPDGDIPDCPFTHPGLLKTNPQNPARVIEWVMESLIGNSTSEAEDVEIGRAHV